MEIEIERYKGLIDLELRDQQELQETALTKNFLRDEQTFFNELDWKRFFRTALGK